MIELLRDVELPGLRTIHLGSIVDQQGVVHHPSTDDLIAVLRRQSRVANLLWSSDAVDDAGVAALARQPNALRSLRLYQYDTGARRLTDTGVRTLLASPLFQNLTALELQGAFTAASVTAVLQSPHINSLTSLGLRSPLLHAVDLQPLATHVGFSSRLLHLQLASSAPFLASWFDAFPALRSLTFSVSTLSPIARTWLWNAHPDLDLLIEGQQSVSRAARDAEIRPIPEDVLEDIERCVRFASEGRGEPTPWMCDAIAVDVQRRGFNALMSVIETDARREAVRVLLRPGAIPNLRWLSITDFGFFSQPRSPRIRDREMEAAANAAPNLEVFEWTSPSVGDATAAWIVRRPRRWRHLSLDGRDTLSDVGVQRLMQSSNLQGLEHVRFFNSNLSAVSLNAILTSHHVNTLRTLHFDSRRVIGNDVLRCILANSTLRANLAGIGFYPTTLTLNTTSGTTSIGANLSLLNQFPRLQVLFSGRELSNEDVAWVWNVLPGLQVLADFGRVRARADYERSVHAVSSATSSINAAVGPAAPATYPPVYAYSNLLPQASRIPLQGNGLPVSFSMTSQSVTTYTYPAPVSAPSYPSLPHNRGNP